MKTYMIKMMFAFSVVFYIGVAVGSQNNHYGNMYCSETKRTFTVTMN